MHTINEPLDLAGKIISQSTNMVCRKPLDLLFIDNAITGAIEPCLLLP